MIPASIHFGGERLLLDPAGALFWPAERILAVADLHLEKGSAAARRGQLVPPLDTRLTLERLGALIGRLSPRVVVALGDSFHDGGGPGRLAPADSARLRGLTDTAEFIWVRGNHDPAPAKGVHGRSMAEWRLGPVAFRHEAQARARSEVSGHFHPKAEVTTRAGVVVRPCFVADEHKIMLPAFGTYTGGLDVRTPAIRGHFPRGGRVFLLGRNRLFSFSLT